MITYVERMNKIREMTAGIMRVFTTDNVAPMVTIQGERLYSSSDEWNILLTKDLRA